MVSSRVATPRAVIAARPAPPRRSRSAPSARSALPAARRHAGDDVGDGAAGDIVPARFRPAAHAVWVTGWTAHRLQFRDAAAHAPRHSRLIQPDAASAVPVPGPARHSARAAENCGRRRIQRPAQSGRDWPIDRLNSQIATASAARLPDTAHMPSEPAQNRENTVITCIFEEYPYFAVRQESLRHSGIAAWAPHVAPLFQERATTNVTTSGAEAGP